ncbi:hypothetical protein LCGC14_1752370 [marine sediment metagenome]|uniref:Phage tail tape measure protein domain-containing protein n=1 Tax=marine sediment metagenome TaxID=412755 RepID=A0A0F9JIK9_9ZZZZ
MAINIGDAVLKLGVDTKDLDKGLKGIGASIKKHQRAIGIGMVAAGGAILAAGALSIKTFAKMGDEVQKMAMKTGFSTEALSELRHAAELSGTSLTGLEKATKRMATSIGDFQDGLMETKRDFDKLGISLEDLKDLSPEEAFLLIGEALADLEDPLERAAVAQGVFGRAGMDLIPMFDQGIAALDSMRQEAHDLGIVFDQEAAVKAEEFTDAMHRMDQSTMGVKMVIADKLIPVLMPLIERITEIIKKITAWADENPELVKTIVTAVSIIGGLLLVLGPLLIMLPGIIAFLPILGGAFALLTGPIGLVILAITALIAIGVLLWKNWDDISMRAMATWNNILTYFNQVWQRVSTIFAGIGEAMWKPIKAAIDFIVRYIQTIVDAITGLWKWVTGFFGGTATTTAEGAIPSNWKKTPGGYVPRPESIIPRPWAKGGVIDEPTLLTSLRTMRPYAIAGEAGREFVTPEGGGKVNIYVELDGRVIAQAIGQPLVDEIRLRTGVRI